MLMPPDSHKPKLTFTVLGTETASSFSSLKSWRDIRGTCRPCNLQQNYAYMSTQRIQRNPGFSTSFVKLILRVIQLSLNHKIHLCIAIIAVILGALFQLMIPGLLGNAVDQAVRVFESSSSEIEDLYWTALLQDPWCSELHWCYADYPQGICHRQTGSATFAPNLVLPSSRCCQL